jgi:hypothetical protein
LEKSKKEKKQKIGGMAQVLECMSSKSKAEFKPQYCNLKKEDSDKEGH